MLNISLIKVITILSCMIGIICGLIGLLPYLNSIALFVLIFLSAAIIILPLIKINILKLESIAESLTIGGIIGFISCISFLLIYIPMAILFIKVFKYATNYGVSLALVHSNLFLIIVLSIFLAAFVATTNGLVGLAIFYLNKFFENYTLPDNKE